MKILPNRKHLYCKHRFGSNIYHIELCNNNLAKCFWDNDMSRYDYNHEHIFDFLSCGIWIISTKKEYENSRKNI